MIQENLQRLLVTLNVLRPGFTEPGFRNLLVIFSGWVRTTGVHAVTEALVATSVAGRRHHEAFHRFFSRGSWCPDEIGRLVFELFRRTVSDAQLRFIIDDTLVHKRGKYVYGIASHLDPVHSTKSHRILMFGHVWVVFAVLVRLPFSRRPWALPLLFRLYRGKKEALRKKQPYRKKTQLAREMLEVVVGWTGAEKTFVAMDSAYCCETVMRPPLPSLVILGSLRGNAVFTAQPTPSVAARRVGRPRVRGRPLPNPRALLKSRRHAWQSCRATLYGKTSTIKFKTLDAQWYRGCGSRLLRIVVQETDNVRLVRVFFSTDMSLSPKEILEGYAERWGIEICFRELKQLLGFGDSSARKRQAVERTAPFVGLSYSLLVLWMMQGVYLTPVAVPPLRPWYQHKRGLSFADVLRAAQRVLATLDVLDPPRTEGTATQIRPAKRPPSTSAGASSPRPLRNAA